MRKLNSQPADVVGESISSFSLTRAGVVDADNLPFIYHAFNEEQYSPLSAILTEKGYFTKGLREGTFTDKFQTVKSNHVKYRIASSDKRKIHFASNDTGITYYSPAWSTKPGYKQSSFFIYLDNNWLRPNEVMELSDNRTQVFVYDQEEPQEFNGIYRYEVKLVTKSIEDYCDPTLLTEGSEGGVGMTIYEQDFSETGSEKYTFNAMGDAYLTLQRVKMSWSGTAAAMEPGRDWYAFEKNGTKRYGYIDHAEKKMMKRAIDYHEYQLLFGKSTVDDDGHTILHNKKGREMMAGNGLLWGNDGAVERPMTSAGWTMKYMEALMQDIDLRAGFDGYKEVVVCGGWNAISSFNHLMKEQRFVTKDNNVEGRGAEKGVNMSYSYYEINDVRIIPLRYRYFDSESRPTKYLSNGEKKSSWDAIIVPLGFTTEGDNLVELVQLRPAVGGTVHGIDSNKEDLASSVDGSSKHYLWQTGIIARTDVMWSFMPWSA